MLIDLFSDYNIKYQPIWIVVGEILITHCMYGVWKMDRKCRIVLIMYICYCCLKVNKFYESHDSLVAIFIHCIHYTVLLYTLYTAYRIQ